MVNAALLTCTPESSNWSGNFKKQNSVKETILLWAEDKQCRNDSI